MKRFITACFLLAAISAYSQKCVVANVKKNLLFIGALDVAVEGYSCKNFTVSIDNGRIEGTDRACSYVVYREKPGKAEISILSKRNKNIIGKVEFRVKRIPDPTAMVGGKAV